MNSYTIAPDGGGWRANGHVSRRGHNWTNTIQDFLDIVRESDLVKGPTRP